MKNAGHTVSERVFDSVSPTESLKLQPVDVQIRIKTVEQSILIRFCGLGINEMK